jgi:hypothetical protein
VSALVQATPYPVALGVGIHFDVEYDTYAGQAALRHSELAEMKRSPAHAQAIRVRLHRSTKATDKGSATHCMVLEQSRFAERFAIKPVDFKTGRSISLATKAGKDWAAVIPDHVTILSQEDAADVMGMAAALYAHPLANALLYGPGGRNEVSVLWDEDGIRCSRRPDRYAPVEDFPARDGLFTGTAIAELKTCDDARDWAFSRAALRYDYYGAADWTMRGIEAAIQQTVPGYEPGSARRRYFIVAVESSAPYGVQIHEPTDEELAEAREENNLLLDAYRECIRTGVWPSYPLAVNALRRPGYAQRHNEED